MPPSPELWPSITHEGGHCNIRKVTFGCGRQLEEGGVEGRKVNLDDVRRMVSGSIEGFPCLEILAIVVFGFKSPHNIMEGGPLAEALSGLKLHPSLKEIHFSYEYSVMPEEERINKEQEYILGTNLKRQVGGMWYHGEEYATL